MSLQINLSNTSLTVLSNESKHWFGSCILVKMGQTNVFIYIQEGQRPWQSRDKAGGGQTTCWVVTGLQKKELVHPAIECSLPVCIDWTKTALVHSQWWQQWRSANWQGNWGSGSQCRLRGLNHLGRVWMNQGLWIWFRDMIQTETNKQNAQLRFAVRNQPRNGCALHFRLARPAASPCRGSLITFGSGGRISS